MHMPVITTSILVFCGAAALIAFLISCTALLVAWNKPREPLEVAQLRAEVAGLRTEQLDLYEKLDAFVKRDNVRQGRARAKDEPQAPAGPETKDQLRQRVMGGLRGIPGGNA